MRTACVLSCFRGASVAGHKEGSERRLLTNKTVIRLSLFLSVYLQYIKLFLLHRYKSWGSSDSTVTRPSAGRPRNCGSIHGTGNRIFTSPKRPNRFLGPINLPQEGLSTGLQQPRRAADYTLLSSWDIKGCAGVSPFSHVFKARCVISAQTTLHLAVTATHVTDRNSTVSHGDTTTERKPDKGCRQGEFCLTFVVPCGKRPPGGSTKGRFSGLWLCR